MNTLRDLVRWREEVGRTLLNLDFQPHDDGAFRFKMSPILVRDSVRVVHNLHGPGYTFRDKEMVCDGNNCLAIIYPVRGELKFSQNGGGALRRPGEAKLLICDQPGQLGAETCCDYVSVVFQPEDLPPSIDLHQLSRSPWQATLPTLRLLRSYIDALNGTFIRPDTELAEVTHRHLLDLVRLTVTEQQGADDAEFLQASTVWEARCRVALEDIARSFRDPHLTEVTIAARQGISVRQLQRIFEMAGTTFTIKLQELRLQAAFDALIKQETQAISISEIAFSAGFSDISHFNRLFRRRFGETPSGVRGKRP